MDLAEHGLVKPEETGAVLRTVFDEMGPHPIALALPPQFSLSQIVDLQASGAEGVQQLIEAETQKHRDTGEGATVYDFSPLRPFSRHQNAFWVTLCKENDVFAQIERLGLRQEDVCEVTSGSNALLTALPQEWREKKAVVLADIDASITQITLVLDGQPVHATTFAIGGGLFTEIIATHRGSGFETAEFFKKKTNLFTGGERLSSLCAVADDWRKELERLLQDWLRDHKELKLSPSSFAVVLSGGGALQPGLVEYLNEDSKIKFSLWPDGSVSPRLAVAYGTALQALSRKPQASLLPPKLRDTWNRLKIHQRLLSITFFLLAATGLVMAAATWQKISLASRKQALKERAEVALEKAKTAEALENDLLLKYERLRPVLRRQEQTLETLQTLSFLEQTRTNRNLWYVLFSDHFSYFSGQTTIATNGTGGINPTNAPWARAFIAELCIDQEGETMRRTLSQVVSELKQSPLFRNVDTLPNDRRKNLADPRVVLPEHHFALVMELAGGEFAHTLLPPAPTNNVPKKISPATVAPPKTVEMTVPAAEIETTTNDF